MGVVGGGSGAGGEDGGGHHTNLSPSLQMVVVMLGPAGTTADTVQPRPSSGQWPFLRFRPSKGHRVSPVKTKISALVLALIPYPRSRLPQL